MISKILITLGVIVACMMMLSSRAKPELKTIPNPEAERNRKLMRNGAFAFMTLMVVAASAMIYFELNKRNTIVTVNVINTQSGSPKSYRVPRLGVWAVGETVTDEEGNSVFKEYGRAKCHVDR